MQLFVFFCFFLFLFCRSFIIFVYLLLLLQFSVINLCDNIFIESLYLSIHAVLLANPFPIFYCQSRSSVWCKALWIVINFRVLLFLFLSSFFVQFKKDPELSSRDTAQVFIPLIRVQLQSLILSSFNVLLRYSFLTLLFFSVWLMVFASNILWYLEFISIIISLQINFFSGDLQLESEWQQVSSSFLVSSHLSKWS